MVQPWTGAPHSWVGFNPWSRSPFSLTLYFLLFVLPPSLHVIPLYFHRCLPSPPLPLCFICLCLSCNQSQEWRPRSTRDQHLETLLLPRLVSSSARLRDFHWPSQTSRAFLPPPVHSIPASYVFTPPLCSSHLSGSIQPNSDHHLLNSLTDIICIWCKMWNLLHVVKSQISLGVNIIFYISCNDTILTKIWKREKSYNKVWQGKIQEPDGSGCEQANSVGRWSIPLYLQLNWRWLARFLTSESPPRSLICFQSLPD